MTTVAPSDNLTYGIFFADRIEELFLHYEAQGDFIYLSA